MLLWLRRIWPKSFRVGSVTGPLRIGVLNTLKASRRAWKSNLSVMKILLFRDMSQIGRLGLRIEATRNGSVRSVFGPRNCHAGFEQLAVPFVAATQPLNH